MEQRVKTIVRLFGEFRNFTEDQELEILIGDRATVEDLKGELEIQLTKLNASRKISDLMKVSALADENGILESGEPLGLRTWFAILPPVSGG